MGGLCLVGQADFDLVVRLSASTSSPCPPSPSPPPTMPNPRIGLAVFLLSPQGYILLGKRRGSHGSGSLALPGGHLEWNESWSGCATREVEEETGLSLSHTPEFLTAVNTTGIDAAPGGHEEDGGLHYVTIFMLSRVARSQVDEVRLTEPHKCDGWRWVPLSYLFSLFHGQEALERLASSSRQQGSELGVSMEKLLMAERLGERIGRDAGREEVGQSERGEADAVLVAGGEEVQQLQQRRGSLGPQDDEEQVAWALADDLFRGAGLFKPMMTVLRERGELLRTMLRAVERDGEADRSRSTSAVAAATAASSLSPHQRSVRLAPNIFPSDATSVINAALSAPPHLKHSLLFHFPVPTPLIASNIVSVLSVDKPLRPRDTRIVYEAARMEEQGGAPCVRVKVETSTVRLLRLTGNAVCEDVALVVRTMQAFPGKASAGLQQRLRGTAGVGEEKVVFEEGTVGTVERTIA